MATLSVLTLDGERVRADQTLRAEMHQLAQPSYEDPSAIIDREIAECTKLYYARDAADDLVCFYITSWEAIDVDGQHVPSVHLGLSCTRQDTKNSGYVTSLYARCLQDAIEQQQASGERFLLWSTTASPTV